MEALDTIDDLLSQLDDTGLAPGEFTVDDFVARSKEAGKALGGNRAYTLLMGDVRSGKLTRRKIRLNGYKVNAFKKA